MQKTVNFSSVGGEIEPSQLIQTVKSNLFWKNGAELINFA